MSSQDLRAQNLPMGYGPTIDFGVSLAVFSKLGSEITYQRAF